MYSTRPSCTVPDETHTIGGPPHQLLHRRGAAPSRVPPLALGRCPLPARYNCAATNGKSKNRPSGGTASCQHPIGVPAQRQAHEPLRTSHAHTVLSWLPLARRPSGRTASERVSRRDESLAPRLQWQLKGRQVPRRRHEGIIACSSAKQRRQLAFRSTKCCVEAVGARSVGLPALGKQLCNYAHRRVYARHVGRVALEMRATASDEPASPHGGSGDILRRRMSHRHARCTYKLVQRAAEHTHNEATDKLLCETTTFDARNLKATPRVRDLTPRGAPDAVAT